MNEDYITLSLMKPILGRASLYLPKVPYKTHIQPIPTFTSPFRSRIKYQGLPNSIPLQRFSTMLQILLISATPARYTQRICNESANQSSLNQLHALPPAALDSSPETPNWIDSYIRKGSENSYTRTGRPWTKPDLTEIHRIPIGLPSMRAAYIAASMIPRTGCVTSSSRTVTRGCARKQGD
jgi:hypothetical protein